MMYTVIYVDKNDGIRKWKKANNIVDAENFGQENSDHDYDICVSAYDYDKLQAQIQRLERKLEQIKQIAEN